MLDKQSHIKTVRLRLCMRLGAKPL